ncbi:hypothetical protein M2323_002125 [Rhodoblastus acidophilus]|uniref:putative Ig domain-containing protein n=1 Tax=Rhodoblastus acidophilus TaxID=1074 RepID=UPI00222583A2|nr:putative Ig domain-containing protein [Rhodoblastus acidophilus]MCW2284326.1 hypothetical protein [Rhodoblastus acidophilus]MCW2333196.1 hypothetical protein [Rhodoblastus acidophilus]
MASLSSLARNHALFDQDDVSIAPIPPVVQAGTADWGALLFAAAPAPSPSATPSTTSTKTTAPLVSASSSLPSWISTITTAAIATDMKAAIVNGAVTEAGLATLMTDLAKSLGSGKLTATQFADLKTIAANLNAGGVSTSAYLTYVFNALVNGNPANATWTGGNAASVALGNLAAGATATQVSELTGKWLLGTDLPSSSVTMGGTKFTVTASAPNLPLFAAGGASMNDVNQGYLGDCYFLSSCAEVALQNQSLIASMFTDNGNGTYGVRLYENGVAQYVTVNSQLANGGAIFNHASDLWASLAEKAYAQLQAGGAYTGNSYAGDSYTAIGNGGSPLYGLEALTGSKVLQEFGGTSSGWTGYTLNASFSVTGYAANQSTSTLLAELIADLKAHDDVILCSNTNAYDSLGRQTLVASHAMSIYGYNTATGLLQVRNPWGVASGQKWATTFEVSLDTLRAAGDWIMVDSAGGVLAPMLLTQTATQTFVKGAAGSFSIAGAFSDPTGKALTYTATQANGSALPSWLAFNTSTGLFSGTAPTTASGVTVIVTAKNSAGLTASETFGVAVAAPTAPKLSAQTANQTVTGGKAVSFALAANTFTDPQGEALTYSATQSNGSALPSWLTFNAATRLFSGTAPTSGGTFALKVTATDTGGASNSETFNLTVSSSAAKVASLLHAVSDGFYNPAAQAVDSSAVLGLLAPAH